MALFYSAGSVHGDSGKFRRSRRPGIQQSAEHTCGGYRLELLSIESNTPVTRTRYHVRILNARNLRVGYLRDFVTARSAIAAGEEWVAERQRQAKAAS